MQRQCQLSSAHASYFQQVRKVSVAISKLVSTSLIFIEPGAKINRQYHQEVLLMHELLPVICSIAGDVFGFLQESAPTHRVNGMVKLLYHEAPRSLAVICAANITYLNPVHHHILRCCLSEIQVAK